MVVGNKLDLEDEERSVDKQTAEDFCQREGMSFIETSARDNTNVEEAFRLLATEALKR